VSGTKAELKVRLKSKRKELADINGWRKQLLAEIKQLTYSLLQLDISTTTAGSITTTGTTDSTVTPSNVSDVDKAS
jgi:hypothetical protein